ncbi:MAG: hypothetical protein ACK4N5_22220, partial [Myxococcales bacterium]
MGRAELAALLASGFLLFSFIRYRVRLGVRRREGPSLELLGRFDYRVPLETLAPLHDAHPGRSGAPVPFADAPVAPGFYVRSPYGERPSEGALGPLYDALL